jgi:hypothetical protein
MDNGKGKDHARILHFTQGDRDFGWDVDAIGNG